MPAKVVHLSSVHHPFDNRIFHKECKTLADAGYEVVLVVPHSQSEVIDNVRVHALPKPASRFERITKTIFAVYRAALKEKGLVYHLHDPELLPVGLFLRIIGFRVIYDVHEDYVTSVQQRKFWPHWIRLVLGRVVCVVEPLLAQFMKIVIAERYYQERFPNSIEVLNYPRTQKFDQVAKYYNKSKSLHLLYTGTVSEDRGAFIYAQLVEQFPELEITLIGRCPQSLVEQMYQIAGDGIDRLHISCTEDGVPYEHVLDAYRKQTWLAGLAIFPLTPHYRKKELTKFFEYMAAGLPIICSDFPVWNQLMQESQAGICVDPYDLDGIMDAIRSLAENPALAESMSEFGVRAVHSRYNWQTQAQELLTLYKDLLA